jgi:hypothetical protein
MPGLTWPLNILMKSFLTVPGSKVPPFSYKASEDRQGYSISTPVNRRIAIFRDRSHSENT